uniref:Prostate and testis expressed 1 n=1 Tax=Jaculus jaculus TaxID=51337 RepID=A0A8C5KV76_JACJA
MGKSLLMSLIILSCYLTVLSGSFSHRTQEGLQVAIDGHDSVMDIVQCRTCHLQFPGEKCHLGRGVCTASQDEACVVGRIFKRDGTPWLMFMDCLRNCANVMKVRWGVYLVNFICCRGSDLCNEK